MPHRRFAFVVVLLVAVLASGRAAEHASGTIEGRVFNTATGEYLENARVSVEGTGWETLTNPLGEYVLTGVPAGEARVRVFFTGLAGETAAVSVAAGRTARRDFNLARFAEPGGGRGRGEVGKLCGREFAGDRWSGDRDQREAVRDGHPERDRGG